MFIHKMYNPKIRNYKSSSEEMRNICQSTMCHRVAIYFTQNSPDYGFTSTTLTIFNRQWEYVWKRRWKCDLTTSERLTRAPVGSLNDIHKIYKKKNYLSQSNYSCSSYNYYSKLINW